MIRIVGGIRKLLTAAAICIVSLQIDAAQAIHLLMESARVGLKQNNPGDVVGAISQLDKLCGLGVRK